MASCLTSRTCSSRFVMLPTIFFCKHVKPIQIVITTRHLSCSVSLKTDLHSSKSESYEENSEENKIQDLYPTHIPTNALQKLLLTIGSAGMAIYSPYRDDMVAVLGETTGYFALKNMHRKMMNDAEGRRILNDRPKINTGTIDVTYLATLPEDSFGYAYFRFLDDNKVSPDTRMPVHFVDDIDLAYVMQRYRETHDLVHTLLGMPTNMLGEVAVKWIEAMQTGLPMCAMGAVFGPLRFYPKQRQKYLSAVLPWAIRCGYQSRFLMNLYYEERWEEPIDVIREEMNLEPPPAIAVKLAKS